MPQMCPWKKRFTANHLTGLLNTFKTTYLIHVVIVENIEGIHDNAWLSAVSAALCRSTESTAVRRPCTVRTAPRWHAGTTSRAWEWTVKPVLLL